MPSPKRERRERTHEWEAIQQRTLWPEQHLYEAIRPLLLFGETAGEREKEIDVPRRTLARKADEFEKYGMCSLFASEEQGGARETPNTLPEEIRQLIVDLHFELPSMSWREMAEVCYIRYARRPHHKHVKRIATSGSLPSLQARRYQTWHIILDPAERKLAVIRLHSDGWSITSIAEYMQTSRGRWRCPGAGSTLTTSSRCSNPCWSDTSSANTKAASRYSKENIAMAKEKAHAS